MHRPPKGKNDIHCSCSLPTSAFKNMLVRLSSLMSLYMSYGGKLTVYTQLRDFHIKFTFLFWFLKSYMHGTVILDGKAAILITIIICPLTRGSLRHHRLIHYQVPPFFPVLHCPLGLSKLQACPFPDVVFTPLPLSALSSSPFHCTLQDGFGQT